MDLGIRGRTAIICASSRGLGKACAVALAREDADLAINGLDEARLSAAARDIRDRAGASVTRLRAHFNASAGALPGECADARAIPFSVHAGFMTGQNLQLDGGSYEGIV